MSINQEQNSCIIKVKPLLKAISRVKSSIFPNDNLSINCLFLDLINDRVFATDGHIMSISKIIIPTDCEDKKGAMRVLLIPRDQVVNLCKALRESKKDALRCFFDDKTISFTYPEKVFFECKLLDYDPIDCDAVIPKYNNKSVVFSKEDFKSVLKACNHFSNVIELDISNNNCKITASRECSIDCENTITCSFELPCSADCDIKVRYKSNYLFDICNACEYKEVMFQFGESNMPCLVEETDQLQVCLPSRF